MQQDLDATRLIGIVILTVFGIATSAILLLTMTIKLLYKAFYLKNRDKALSSYIFKSVGISWGISLGAYILLTIFINIF